MSNAVLVELVHRLDHLFEQVAQNSFILDTVDLLDEFKDLEALTVLHEEV